MFSKKIHILFWKEKKKKATLKFAPSIKTHHRRRRAFEEEKYISSKSFESLRRRCALINPNPNSGFNYLFQFEFQEDTINPICNFIICFNSIKMSAIVCGKRSFFEDMDAAASSPAAVSPPSYKRFRCSSSTSPVRFTYSPPVQTRSAVDQLKDLFPEMDIQVNFLLFAWRLICWCQESSADLDFQGLMIDMVEFYVMFLVSRIKYLFGLF